MLLTGASGLLGHWMMTTASADAPLVALTHRHGVSGVSEVRADLRDAGSTMTAVGRANPSLIVHAAYAHDRAAVVDATEHVVAAACEVGADILFISTDAVFGGDGIERDEASQPDPVWDYGRWKAEAEDVVARRCSNAAIVRLPLLVSIDPDDHVVREIRRRVMRDETTQWFIDETRQPAPASEIAAAIWKIVELTSVARSGVWHLPGAECLTRHEIALRVVKRLGARGELVRGTTTPQGAIRPRHIMFTGARASATIGWNPSPVLH
ncbi:MAG TPA: sugar nucleotide-binding protein [Acidimicrobiia bacterium]